MPPSDRGSCGRHTLHAVDLVDDVGATFRDKMEKDALWACTYAFGGVDDRRCIFVYTLIVTTQPNPTQNVVAFSECTTTGNV